MQSEYDLKTKREMFLRDGVAVNWQDATGFSLLFHAIFRRRFTIHFGLLSLDTDPHAYEYRWRLLSAKTTGESIPSFKPISGVRFRSMHH
jgi:hypothetical protein